MAWVKLSDDFFERPGLQRVGPEARLLYTVGQTYIAKHLTDGHIASEAVPTLAHRSGIGKVRVRRVAEELVREGLWDVTVGGWHDPYYLDDNRTAAQDEARRASGNQRQRRHQDRKRRISAENQGISGVSSEFSGNFGEDHQEGETKSNGVTNAPPYPFPYSLHVPSEHATAGASAGDANTEETSRGGHWEVGAQGSPDTVAPSDALGSSDFTMELGEAKTSRTNYRSQGGETTSGYRDRLRRAYLDAKPSSRDRMDISYAWACHWFGQDRVKYGAVVALLKRAGNVDAYMRAISRAADMGEMEDPIHYAMGIVSQNTREGRGPRRVVGQYGSEEERANAWEGFQM